MPLLQTDTTTMSRAGVEQCEGMDGRQRNKAAEVCFVKGHLVQKTNGRVIKNVKLKGKCDLARRSQSVNRSNIGKMVIRTVWQED